MKEVFPMIRNVSDEISAFRKSRGQSSEPSKRVSSPPKKRKGLSPYDTFLKKYANLEECIDDFGTRDLVYYFREIAGESGYNYVIANIKKDMAIMKRLKDNFSVREICGMIEFLYTSEQDYLEKDRLSINLLASQWINTIYADMKLWVDDKYVPRKSRKALKTHEWDKSVAGTDNDTKIGVKL